MPRPGGAIGAVVALGMKSITEDFRKQAAASRINAGSTQALARIMTQNRDASGREVSRLDRLGRRAEAEGMRAGELAISGMGPLEGVSIALGQTLGRFFGPDVGFGFAEEEAAQARQRQQRIELLKQDLARQGVDAQSLGAQFTRTVEQAFKGERLEIEQKLGRRSGNVDTIKYNWMKTWGAVFGDEYINRERFRVAQEMEIKRLENMRRTPEADINPEGTRPENRIYQEEFRRQNDRINRWRLERFMDWNRS